MLRLELESELRSVRASGWETALDQGLLLDSVSNQVLDRLQIVWLFGAC